MKNILLLCLLNSFAFASSYMKDGKMYLYSNSTNNTVECTIQQMCDISLAPGDVFQSWIMTDGGVWADSVRTKTSFIDKAGVEHIIIQSVGLSDNNPVILVGVNNQYRFNLKSVKHAKTNLYAFIDKKTTAFNSTNAIIDDGLKLDFRGKKLDYEYYMKGDTNSYIKPVKVFNDGHKTYVEMPDNIDTTDLPVIYTFNKNGELHQLNNPRYRKPYFIVDNVMSRIAIVSGSGDNSSGDDQLRIDIWHGKKPTGWAWLMQQYDN